ncbi:hypothetical protein DRW03_33645 [Corallococcus sp. H22C18031201]|nr:hypothetical protein DRW03_33645 [Corallococcus sp. H22C18031201]
MLSKVGKGASSNSLTGSQGSQKSGAATGSNAAPTAASPKQTSGANPSKDVPSHYDSHGAASNSDPMLSQGAAQAHAKTVVATAAQSKQVYGASRPLPPPQANSKESLLAFHDKLKKTYSDTAGEQRFFGPGESSQGGVSNTERRLEDHLKTLNAMPSTHLDQVADRAVFIASKIVEEHLFRDGNGRTALFSIYSELASHGYRLRLDPDLLHAFTLGEENKQSLPPNLKQLITAFAIKKPEGTLAHDMPKRENQLIELEATRVQLTQAIKHFQAAGKDRNNQEEVDSAWKGKRTHVLMVEDFRNGRIQKHMDAVAKRDEASNS